MAKLSDYTKMSDGIACATALFELYLKPEEAHDDLDKEVKDLCEKHRDAGVKMSKNNRQKLDVYNFNVATGVENE